VRQRQVAVSSERYAQVGDGVDICFQTFGEPSDPPVLLVMGLGGPMTWWDPGLCRLLAAEGYFVIRYDNRDSGRSSRLPGQVTRRTLVRALAGRPVPTPYLLSDMARDAVGLLDHLRLGSAHVVGLSMGGMIAQTLAIEHPDRTRSLTSVMSTVGRRTVGWQSPRILPLVLARRRPGRSAYAESSARLWRLIQSPAYRQEPDPILRRAHDTFDRGWDPAGVMRQLLAVVRQPDRTRHLAAVRVPTLVIHGSSDRMVHVSGGRATAAAIPGAELLLVPGMGHDLPQPLHAQLVEAITRVARRADAEA
jgi:pimeloyl-ACP methyl ester carboxylesterase